MLVMGLSEQFQQAVAVVARQEFGPESQVGFVLTGIRL